MAAAKKKRLRKAGMGSAKGAAFEREIAKRISLWISEGKTQDLLWRSAGSGGRSTLRRKATGKGIEYHASDIAPLHPDAEPFTGTFTLECKNYASLKGQQILYGFEGSQIDQWWQQAVRDAASVKRIPLMIMKELRQEPLIVLPDSWYLTMKWQMLDLGLMPLRCVHLMPEGVYIVGLDALLKGVTFKRFRDVFTGGLVYHVPSTAHQRSAPDRQPIRRVPLVNLRSPRRSRQKVRRQELVDPR